MTSYALAQLELRTTRCAWLITGAAGFIGSNLLETLLGLGQRVRGLDNFAAGKRGNLEQVRAAVGDEAWRRFEFVEGDIRDAAVCRSACAGMDYVLHHAALGSVPASIDDPLLANAVNIDGTLNLLVGAREHRVKRFVYATSSAIYGNQPEGTIREEQTGRALSPYAVTKQVNEQYADVFATCYGTESIGLRYFNVFGPRQDPKGAYAAVIPCWIASLLKGEPVFINGDGGHSRDFCYVANVVQANLLAATIARTDAVNRVYNVALNQRTTLNELFATLCELLAQRHPEVRERQPVYRAFRPGDVRHSQADIARARQFLGYEPTHGLAQGLAAALDWYEANLV
jgi:UDP-N-acetylglucosamine 4-epimerase